MWHVTNKNFFTHHVAYFWIPYNLRSIQEYTICNKWQVTSDKWHVTCDMWHVTCDMWHVTCDLWQVNTCLPIMLHIFGFLMTQGVHKSIQYVPSDKWHVTYDIWHLTCDMWHVTNNKHICTIFFCGGGGQKLYSGGQKENSGGQKNFTYFTSYHFFLFFNTHVQMVITF